MELDFSIISDLAIGSVAIVPIIIGLVALAKKMAWIADDKAPYLAGFLSVVGFVAVEVLKVYPQFMTVAEPVATAVFIFLVVSGTYQLSKTNKK
jgi:hypothetical protein